MSCFHSVSSVAKNYLKKDHLPCGASSKGNTVVWTVMPVTLQELHGNEIHGGSFYRRYCNQSAVGLSLCWQPLSCGLFGYYWKSHSIHKCFIVEKHVLYHADKLWWISMPFTYSDHTNWITAHCFSLVYMVNGVTMFIPVADKTTEWCGHLSHCNNGGSVLMAACNLSSGNNGKNRYKWIYPHISWN